METRDAWRNTKASRASARGLQGAARLDGGRTLPRGLGHVVPGQANRHNAIMMLHLFCANLSKINQKFMGYLLSVNEIFAFISELVRINMHINVKEAHYSCVLHGFFQ